MNTKDLQTIKNADFTDDTHADKICNEMRDIVGRKTDDFTKPDNLSDTKIDMTDTIKQYGYDVELYKQKFGSVQRSELQAAEHLLQMAKDKGGTPSTPSTPEPSEDANKAKRLKLAKAKIMIEKEKRLRLELEEKEK